MITEDKLEQLCLDWFSEIGYEVVCGYDIAPDGNTPERADYRQVVLHDRQRLCAAGRLCRCKAQPVSGG